MNMKTVAAVLACWVFLVAGWPIPAGAEQVRRVSKEKWDKLTPAQKERFRQMGRDAQKAAEDSMKDYNEVGDSVDKAKDAIKDKALQPFKPKVQSPPPDGLRG